MSPRSSVRLALRALALVLALAAAPALTACSSAPGAAQDGGAIEEDGGAVEQDGGSVEQDGGGADVDGGPARTDGGATLPALGRTPIQQLYIQPRDDNSFMLSAISAARTSIEGVFYILTDNDVERALVAAKRAGRRVRVILDGVNDSTRRANAAAKAILGDGGVEVRDGPSRFVNMHQKTLVVDNTRAFIMTLNPSAAAFQDNREYAVEVRNRLELEDLRLLFEADWTNGADPGLSSPLVVSPINARQRLWNLLRRATRDVILTVEVFTDEGIRTSLKQLKDAGVRVRIVLADPRDVESNAQSATVLKSWGLDVRFLRRPMMHAKLIVVDDALAYVGSVNMTPTSIERNREVGVIVDDTAVIRSLRTQAEADWNAAVPPDGGL